MKYAYILFFSILSSSIMAQPEDEQWYITPDYLKGIGSYTGPVITECNILNVSHPSPISVPNPSPGGDGKPKNDLFIIFKNGQHFNSRGQAVQHPTPPNSNYYLNSFSLSGIRYLYFTNLYEGDETPAKISISGVSSSLHPYPVEYNTINNVPAISANHDVARDKDITLIVNHKILQRNINTQLNCNYKLCFDVIIMNGNKVKNNEVALTPSNIFDGTFVYNGVGSYDPSSNPFCIDFEPDFSNDFSYINFKAPKTIPLEYLNQQIQFLLASEECGTFRHTEYLRSAHDPNYVKVVCVSEEERLEPIYLEPKKTKRLISSPKKYARYLIHCYNESSDGGVGSLKFGVTFPEAVLTNTIRVQSANIGNQRLYAQSVHKDINGQYVEFSFLKSGKHLSRFDQEMLTCTGSLELCVQLVDTFDLRYGDLKPSNAQSFFDGILYPIVNFVDRCTSKEPCLEKFKVPNMKNKHEFSGCHMNQFPYLNGQTEGCRRENVNTCNCAPGQIRILNDHQKYSK